MHKVLVNCLFKLAQEKVWLADDRPAMTIAVDLVRKAKSKQSRPPDKSMYWNAIFFIFHPKHMLWVLKRTVSEEKNLVLCMCLFS